MKKRIEIISVAFGFVVLLLPVGRHVVVSRYFGRVTDGRVLRRLVKELQASDHTLRNFAI